LKIKTLEDILAVSNMIIGRLVATGKVTTFNLLVDHGEGTISNASFTPACDIGKGKCFLAVTDYSKLLLLLQLHPRISELTYDDKEGMITALFKADEMQTIEELEHT
jgi:hypothetical protein